MCCWHDTPLFVSHFKGNKPSGWMAVATGKKLLLVNGLKSSLLYPGQMLHIYSRQSMTDLEGRFEGAPFYQSSFHLACGPT